MKTQKGSPVIRFDIGCQDHVASREFYTKVFGWKFAKAPHNHSINTGSEVGIPGSLTSLGHEPHQYIMIYIEVESVSEAIKSIKSNGGKNHIGPLPTGTGQYFAWVKDPEGNQLGIVSDKE